MKMQTCKQNKQSKHSTVVIGTGHPDNFALSRRRSLYLQLRPTSLSSALTEYFVLSE